MNINKKILDIERFCGDLVKFLRNLCKCFRLYNEFRYNEFDWIFIKFFYI